MKKAARCQQGDKNLKLGLLFATVFFALSAPAWAVTISGLGGGQITNGNLVFSNFSVNTSADEAASINGVTFGANTVTAPSTSTINVSTNGDGIQFDTGSVPPCTTGSFCISGKNQSLTVTIVFLVSTADHSSTITTADLFGQAHSHANTTGSVAYIDTCGTGASAVCAANPTGVIQLGAATGGNVNVSGPVTTAAFSATNQVWVRETIYLVTNNGSGSDSEFLAEGAIASPEPATYGLVGFALAGFGALRFKRRRKTGSPAA